MPAKHVLGNIWAIGGEKLSHRSDSAVLCIKGEDGQIVTIEQGSGADHHQLIANAAEIGIDLNSVTTHYGSHGHGDHVFGFDQMNPKSVLRIGKDAIPPLVTGDHNLDASFLMPEVKQPRFEESRLEPLYNGFQAEIGSTQLTAVKTSGHSPGHFCFKLDTPEGSMLYAGDAVFQCGSEAAGTDFERWKQDFETVPQNHNFDFIYLGHCNNNLLPNGMEFWRLASRMFLADFKLSHDGLYINPFGNPKLPESIPVEPPNSELIQAVCLQNWANKVLYDLGLFVAEKS